MNLQIDQKYAAEFQQLIMDGVEESLGKPMAGTFAYISDVVGLAIDEPDKIPQLLREYRRMWRIIKAAPEESRTKMAATVFSLCILILPDHSEVTAFDEFQNCLGPGFKPPG